jgi:hypothetical protein
MQIFFTNACKILTFFFILNFQSSSGNKKLYITLSRVEITIEALIEGTLSVNFKRKGFYKAACKYLRNFFCSFWPI